MNLALQFKMADLKLSPLEALTKGGFVFTTNADGSIIDADNVSLKLRKYSLARRVQMVKKQSTQSGGSSCGENDDDDDDDAESTGTPSRRTRSKRKREDASSCGENDDDESTPLTTRTKRKRKRKDSETFPLGWTERSVTAAHGSGSGDNDVHTRLWHVPDVPQKPSFLDFLGFCASMKLKQTELCGSAASGGKFEVSEFRHGSEPEKDDSSSDDDSTYEELKKENEERWNGARIGTWHASEEEKKAHEEECQHLQLQFDETAAVAIGVLSEECMISSLLPLARKHVSRCRILDLDVHNAESKPVGDSAMQWILPPDEAIIRISLEKKGEVLPSQVFIPSSRPPSVSTRIRTDFEVTTLAELLNGRQISTSPSVAEERKKTKYAKVWCKENGFETDFVLNNMELFRLFINDSMASSRGTSNGRDMNIDEAERAEKALTNTVQFGGTRGTDYDGEFPIPNIIARRVI